ncbi:ATP-binding protein [Roseibium polysiphoniae]|uniref:ATP-binding protein n=1 Tax=Roseibium polysiphoniae TaxID=2571221 RepID=UPI00329A22F3
MASQNNKRADERQDLTYRAELASESATGELNPKDPRPAENLEGRRGPRDLREKVWPSARFNRSEAPTFSEQDGETDATKPAASAVNAPSKSLLMLSAVGAAGGTIGAFMLVGSPATQLLAIALAFFAGAMAVWRLLADDQQRAAEGLAAKDTRIKMLQARCEELEDRTWELRESDERQASILSTLGDIVIRRDTDSTVVYANTAAHEAFGNRQGPMIGLPLTLPRVKQAGMAGDHPLEDPEGGFGDVMLETNHGTRWFSRIDVSVRDTTTDQPLIQTVLRDVTDRRMIEDELLAARHSAENSNEAKSRFLATVSHEIRTPLNGILGMAALLRDTRVTKEQTAYISALETSGETLLLLIDEVLDFSKVEAGKLEIQTGRTALAGLAENVVELLAPKAHAKGLEIGTRIDPALPDLVTLDATRVRQILFNLAGNGVKFTDEGGMSIEIDGRDNPDGGCFLDICVRDTGIGFNKDQADRLFQEFEQVDHGPARKFGGTGLGLAIAQRLAGLMNGRIYAEPDPNKGARFTVSLPIPETLRSAADASTSGKSVVLVSTGQIEAPLLAARLGAEGAQVHLVAPGSADMQDRLAHADLILIDNSAVPDAGGWLATARLAGCAAPAVVLVAPPERDRLARLREAGYAAYLIRPVRMESLSQVTSGLLKDADAAHCWDIEATATPSGSLTQSSLVPARPLRLLVAEDNDINRLLSEALLRKLGHEPVMVIDGEKAVEAAAKIQFDAILMDLHMPGLDGIGAIEQIRAQEDSAGRPAVPILMVTADVMQDARDKAAAVGAAGYLTKPLSAEAISTALTSLPRTEA